MPLRLGLSDWLTMLVLQSVAADETLAVDRHNQTLTHVPCILFLNSRTLQGFV